MGFLFVVVFFIVFVSFRDAGARSPSPESVVILYLETKFQAAKHNS